MPHDPRQIFNTARSFSLAANRSLEQRPLGQGQSEVLMVPAVACQAFAIELYFKAIITLEGGSATGHELGSLYSKIRPNTQAAIRTRASLSEVELNSKLEEVSKAFVEWRYIFESQSAHMDLEFLRRIVQAAGVEVEIQLGKVTPAALRKRPESGE